MGGGDVESKSKNKSTEEREGGGEAGELLSRVSQLSKMFVN